MTISEAPNSWKEIDEFIDRKLLNQAGSVPVQGVTGLVDRLQGKLESPAADADLASPNNPVYRSVLEGQGVMGIDLTAGTRFLTAARATGGLSSVIGSGSNMLTESHAPPLMWIDDGDYPVAGKTTQMRLRALAGSNGTDAGIDLHLGLYPVTFSGGVDTMTLTAGTVVAEATITNAALGTSDSESATTADFAVPADGAYSLAVRTTGTLANNAAVLVAAQLQMRHT